MARIDSDGGGDNPDILYPDVRAEELLKMTEDEVLVETLCAECRDTSYGRTSGRTLPKRSPDVLRAALRLSRSTLS